LHWLRLGLCSAPCRKHLARPSTKRKRGAAADAGGQSLGLGSAGRSRDERAANRSNRRQDQQQQEEDEQEEERQQQQRQRQQQEQQRQQQEQQEQEQREAENQAMHEAAAASLVTAEAEHDAAVANTLFASILKTPLYTELEKQSQRVDAACSEAIATKCINCISAVTMPLMCTTCTYKPVCAFCVVKFAATRQTGAIGDTVPCMSCKTPLITAAELREMFSGERILGKTMHQMLVDTMLELARVKDIEDKGLVCEV
jgi:transcription initiation factor TFIID subunit TAF12